MAVSFAFMSFVSKNLFSNENASIQKWWWCFYQKLWEIHEVYLLPLAFGGGST